MNCYLRYLEQRFNLKVLNMCTSSMTSWTLIPFWQSICLNQNLTLQISLSSQIYFWSNFGKIKHKKFNIIDYVKMNLNEAQVNYVTTENWLLMVVFANDKLCSCSVGSNIFFYIYHVSIKYLLIKKDIKSRLIRWIINASRKYIINPYNF